MATRRYMRPFTATIVPIAVDLLKGQTGPYALMRDAAVSRDGKPDSVRTVMAFSQAYEDVSHLLAAGRPIALTVRYSGGSLKVVGLADAPARTDLLVPHEAGRSYGETVALTLEAVLASFGIAKDAVPGIIEDMMAGGVENDEDRTFDIDPDLQEMAGHVLGPLAVAQLDETTALAVTDAIMELPIAGWLADAAMLRRQTSAREFLLAA
jgi:hypothetical protein